MSSGQEGGDPTLQCTSAANPPFNYSGDSAAVATPSRQATPEVKGGTYTHPHPSVTSKIFLPSITFRRAPVGQVMLGTPPAPPPPTHTYTAPNTDEPLPGAARGSCSVIGAGVGEGGCG